MAEPLNIGPTGSHVTSVLKKQPTLLNNPEDGRMFFNRDKDLRSNSTGYDARVSEDGLTIRSRWRLARYGHCLHDPRLLIAVFLTIPCPVVAARCSFQSMSSNTLMPASVCPSTSVNLKHPHILLVVLCLGSSASSRTLCFRTWPASPSMNCWP